MQRAVIYCRCSTEEESQKNALLQQVKEAKDCVEQKGWILTDSYIESRSGTSTKGRKEYRRLFEDLSGDCFDLVVIKSQDRLMRNTKDWYLFIDRMTSFGKRLFLYLENKFYSSNDALLTGMKAILAEEYSRELSKKINHAHRLRQEKGETVILTSNVYGYQKLPDKRIVLVEEEAEIKRRMYELCAAGYGGRTIASVLRKEGITNRKGRPFTDTEICRMIRNPLHKGTVVMHRTHYDFETKKTLKIPKEEQFVHEHKVPAIVSEELWEAANAKIDQRVWKRSEGSVRLPGKYPLSGKLYCGICREPYYRTVRKSADGPIFEWKCRRYLQEGRKSAGAAGSSLQKEETDAPQGCENIFLNEKKLQKFLQKTAKSGGKTEKEYIVSRMTKLLREVLDEKTEQKRIGEIEKFLTEEEGFCSAAAAEFLEGIEKIFVYPKFLEIYPYAAEEEASEKQPKFFRAALGSTFDYREQKREERENIVELLRENPQMTARQIAQKLDVSLSGVRYRLRVLKKEGRIRFLGSGGKGMWEILQPKHY